MTATDDQERAPGRSVLEDWDARRSGRAGAGTAVSGGSTGFPRELSGKPHQRSWAAKTLAGEVDEVASTPQGARNGRLNAAGMRCFRQALAGLLDAEQVTEQLVAAGQRAGLPELECRRTLRSASDGALRDGPADDVPQDPPSPREVRTLSLPPSAGAAHLAGQGTTAAQVPPEGPRGALVSSWAPQNLGSHLDGTHVQEEPVLLERQDGRGLLYPGRTHSLHGESESGKSWVALVAAAEVLANGGRVLMLDFESDAGSVTRRLLAMGVSPVVIGAGFTYVHPEVSPERDPGGLEAWAALLGEDRDLVVIDGVTAALTVFGVSSKDNDEVTAWSLAVPDHLARATGAAVVMVDHVTKDADSRGRFAIGGQAKMSALTGAAYVVEVLQPLGVGLLGRVSLRVGKDRPGGVRPHSGAYRKGDRTQEAAVVVVDSTTTGRTVVTVEPPRADLPAASADGDTPFRPTALMERVSQTLENANGAGITRNGLAQATSGRRAYVLRAVDQLMAEGHIVEGEKGRNGGGPMLRLVTPFRDTQGAPLQQLDLPVGPS